MASLPHGLACSNPEDTLGGLRVGREHGEWRFAGADYRRKATNWRCPTGECQPASTWVKASRPHPLVPRDSARGVRLYRSRGAIEREFGRLKNEWSMAPLRVRRTERVRLHVDLTILARPACRLPMSEASQPQSHSRHDFARASLGLLVG